MAIIRAFKAIRPTPELADRVAALPYDVMDSKEARQMAAGNPYSFLHVDKAEIDLDPAIDLYDTRVYEKARDNLDQMIADGVFIQDETPCLYIYKQVMDGRAQIGIVGCASIDDYRNNVIKKHELTRADKEQDRINHVDYCDANTGPIFLTYRAKSTIDKLVADTVSAKAPVYDFTSDDGISHTVWVIDDAAVIDAICMEFAAIDNLYIADGHHRSASAVRVGGMRRDAHPDHDGSEEFNYFLSVIFPDNHLYIMDYNRIVKDLNGLSKEAFLAKVSGKFSITPYEGRQPLKPRDKHTFGMYLDGKWMLLTALDGTYDASDPVARLDVSILQNNLLHPILGIGDPRTDKRIDFIGGIRGLQALSDRVDNGSMAVAFSMYPTTMDDLMDIADAGAIMPPKSTWFEPKLRSGLFVHKLTDWARFNFAAKEADPVQHQNPILKNINSPQKFITIGEIMLRLTPPNYEKIRMTNSFEANYGGSEANIALALANLGIDSTFFSVVPNNSIGKSAIRTLRSNDVHCTPVILSTPEETPTHRLGTYYLETGYGIRASKVIYDRKHSAITEYDLTKVDLERLFDGFDWLHLSGITPALCKSCADFILRCLVTAKQKGMTVSFDGNFRSRLWTWEEARDYCTLCLPYVDVLFGIEPYHLWKDEEHHTKGDWKDGVPLQPSYEQQEEVFQHFIERYPNLKCIARHVRYAHSGSQNSLKAFMWYQGHTFESKLFTFNILDRVGGGDAFASGLIYAMMHDYKPMDMLNFAVASSVIKHTIRGDANITDDAKAIKEIMNLSFDIQR